MIVAPVHVIDDTLCPVDGAGVKLDEISLGVVQAVSSGKPKITGLVHSPGYTQLR